MNLIRFLGTVLMTVPLLAQCAGCFSPTVPTAAASSATPQKPFHSNLPSGPIKFHDETALDESLATVRFTQMNESAGVEHTYRNDSQKKNRRILESVGGGGGMFDFDRDGLLDLGFAGGGYYQQKSILGHPTTVFRNLGDWKFVNVTAVAGGGFPSTHFSHGFHAADYDNDGFLDFVICGYGGIQLWHNLGDGTFEEVHERAALLDKQWSTCAGWGDLNDDGCLDLYIVTYADWSLDNDPICPGPIGERETCPPKEFNSLPDTLYFSNGDGTFSDVTREAGIYVDPIGPDRRAQELGKGLGVLINDFDLDGDEDIYVANDTVDNNLYLNQGNGKFVEDGVLRGVATDDMGMPNGSMGTDVGDFNRDGRPDLWVTNYLHEANGLYRNDGGGQFTHVSRPLGITAVGALYVGFGTTFCDINRDGFEDIMIANGHVQFFPIDAPLRQEPIIQINEKGERFRRQKLDSDPYFGRGHVGRGLMTGDIDDDGDSDFCFVNNYEPCGLIRNDSIDDGQWLRVRLIGTTSNRDGIGARLTLHTDQGDMLRLAKGSSSFASQCDLRPMWGFPKGTKLMGLSIVWPSGIEQEVDVVANQETTVTELENTLEPAKTP